MNKGKEYLTIEESLSNIRGQEGIYKSSLCEKGIF